MNCKRVMKNSKAISPIFATLILIAIAVIAGVVVYMFTSGTLATMTGGGTAAQEKVTVQGVSYQPQASGLLNGGVTVYAQNMASTGSLKVTSILIKDSQGNTAAMVSTLSQTNLDAGTLATISGALSAKLIAGTYTATVTTASGGNFLSQPFTVTTP